jgi:hypothetical protein
MRLKCPHCSHAVVIESNTSGPVACPDCGLSLRGNNPMVPVGSHPVNRAVARRRGAVPFDPEEYQAERQERHEEREERRDERLFRREERDDYRDDRREEKDRNGFAIAGFSIALACLLLIAGGLLFSKQLPVYLGVALTLSLPGSLVGFVLSLLGCFLRKVMQPLALAGAGIGGLLLLILIPAGFMMLKF